MASAIVLLAAWMQFTPPPQARTPEEYDAYLDVAEAPSPTAVLEAAARFQRAYPQSDLRPQVLERCFEAHRAKGDRPAAIDAGEASLEGAAHNIALRAALAAVLANGANEAEAARAESHARRALDDLSRFHPPRTASPEDWRRIEGKVRSAAHSALGMVAFRRGATKEATGQFEQALRFGPDPAVCYRLGKLYQVAGRMEEAAAMFRTAILGNEPTVRALAEKELAR